MRQGSPLPQATSGAATKLWVRTQPSEGKMRRADHDELRPEHDTLAHVRQFVAGRANVEPRLMVLDSSDLDAVDDAASSTVLVANLTD
jgi:hypothetical protein